MKKWFFLFLLVTLLFSPLRAEDSKPDQDSILIRNGLTEQPKQMVRAQLLRELEYAQKEREEALKQVLEEKAPLDEYQESRKAYFWNMLGELWEKTPLNPSITRKITGKDGVRIEITLLETLPHFYASGALFLPNPDRFAPPYPALLIVCGHTEEGKACGAYQGIGRLAAENGIAAYVQDPIDQGERFQIIDDEGKHSLWGTHAHNLVGATSLLLGRNTATFEVWDMVRALDYLESRPEIDSTRLGVAGNSGGGTQSSYLMALDSRIAVAAPSCYLCSLYGDLTHNSNPQDAEQNIFGQAGFGMDHLDYVIMRAPKPTLLCTRTKDFFNIDDTWKNFRDVKRIYSTLRHAEDLDIIEIDGEHGYCPQSLEATVRWMIRYLKRQTVPVTCPNIIAQVGLLTPDQGDEAQEGFIPTLRMDEIAAAPAGGIMAIPGARTTYDLNRDLNKTLVERRQAKAAHRTVDELAQTVRHVAGIRSWDEIPMPVRIDDNAGSEDFVLNPSEGIYLPLRPVSLDTEGDILLIVTQNGRNSEEVQKILNENPNRPAAVVELRGWGETQDTAEQYYQHAWFGTDGVIFYYAYLMGKSFIGMRSEDLLATTKYLAEQTGKKISLIADGPSAGIVVLHANAAAPGIFASIQVPDDIPTWTEQVEKAPAPIQLTDTIHGVLNEYDINDLR